MARKKKAIKSDGLTRFLAYMRRHLLDIGILAFVLSATGIVTAVNLSNYPMRFEDEGTYVSQAWAVQHRYKLTHYTYWYDHPPLAWMQIAGYTALTGAFERYESAVSAGREFMLVLHIVSALLLYLIMRRLGIAKMLAGLGTLAFGISPLGIEFGRYVLLDNIALPWLLAAMLAALSPKKSLVAFAASGLFMAFAILSKETFLIFLPALLYVLWQNADKRNRRYTLVSFAIVFLSVTGLYALYAMLKNELVPGPGHVSLLGTLTWQLVGRVGSGSVLSAGSDARGLLEYWLKIDPWLLFAGLAALPFAFIERRFRPFALAYLIGIVMMMRNGYLPYPYVIGLLPFAALALTMALQTISVKPFVDRLTSPIGRIWQVGGVLVVLAVVVGFTTTVIPAWSARTAVATRVDNDRSSRQTVEWVKKNVSKSSRMVVESALWSDLQNDGFNQPEPVWLYKTETDPEVSKELRGWRGIDYIVLNGPTLDERSRPQFPTVFEAKDHAKIVADFGKDENRVIVMKVDNGRKD